MVTRHNYEEFFLLYVDNELSDQQRNAVESFIRENPDLKEELFILQQTMLDPAAAQFEFDAKQSLYRHTEQAGRVDHSNYEEFLLMYLDRELDSAMRAEVEAFAALHPSVKAELEILKMTVLKADENIVFENKDQLYRKQEAKRRVMVPWLRVAAAAVILLFAGLMMLRNTQTNTAGQLALNPSATKDPVGLKNISTENLPASVTTKTVDSLQHTKASVAASQPNGRRQNQVQGQKPGSVIAQKESTEFLSRTVRRTEIAGLAPDKGVQAKVSALSSGNLDTLAATRSAQLLALGEPEGHPDLGKDQGTLAVATGSELNANTEDFIYTSNTSSKKTKMRGLIRRVSRVFEKTTNVDEDDNKRAVMIGSFQIALK